MEMVSTKFCTGGVVVYILLFSIKDVTCGITQLGDLNGYVGGDVTFKWNASAPTNISIVKWGLYKRDKDLIYPSFLTVENDKVTNSSNLDNGASWYRNRVHFIGNIAQGHAWFKITDLRLNDSREYAARITDSLYASGNYQAKLNVTDAAFTWIRSDASVDFIQGKTAKLVWTVDVGSPYKWFKVFIYRNKEKSQSGEETIIDLLESNGVKNKHLSGREADIDLVVQGTSNVVNVTFTLHNLVKTTDEKYYRISLLNSNFNTKFKYTFLRVLVFPGKPVLQLQPDKSGFCRNDTINITCNGLSGHPPPKLTFLQNDSTIGMLNGTTSGNYTKAVLSHALTQPGTLKFSCNATNAAGSSPTSNVVTITVKDPPVITSCTNNTVVENKNLVWTCDVSGSLPLTISWFKGNKSQNGYSVRQLYVKIRLSFTSLGI